MAEDIEAFAAEDDGNVEFGRIAVTPERARALNLPSDPPKPTDKRGLFTDNEIWHWKRSTLSSSPRSCASRSQTRLDRVAYDRVVGDAAKSRQGVVSRPGLD
jgi:hypothetical protein